MNTLLAILCVIAAWAFVIFAPYYIAKFLLVHITKAAPPPKEEEKIVCWLAGFAILLLGSLSGYASFQLFNDLVKNFGG